MIFRSTILCMGLMVLFGCAGKQTVPTQTNEQTLVAQYQRFETQLRSEGRLITERQADQIIVSNQELLRNFLVIALFAERFERNNQVIANGGEGQLIRWERPLSYRVFSNHYKDSILTSLTAKTLQEVTGQTIMAANEQTLADIKILILTESERELLRQDLANTPQAAFLDLWLENPLFPCAGSLATHPINHSIEQAIIFIKDEVGPFLRSACIEEEFAQAMGPINDSVLARPSQFNDDFEFGYLTDHDRLIMKILYDRRLTSGMKLLEVAPIAAHIIQEFRPNGGEIYIEQAIKDARLDARLPELIANILDKTQQNWTEETAP